ncbi:MAG: DUF922 domain-containing Zn-dependent protease [Gammaproteobacteria bacterium]|nr:DUF922 domain-containing Zn-dependent protease [Gammaproteobacteria bacterium]
MRALLTICLAFFGSQATSADNLPLIEWNSERPLTWDDFQGSVPSGADEARVASTTASLSWSYEYQFSLSRDTCAFSIVTIDSAALFHPDESWVRAGHRNAAVLAHEQVHFDIAQLYFERFVAETRELIGSDRECRGRSERTAARNAEREVTRLVGSVYDEVWRQYRSRQESYDRETRHGIDTVAQAGWTQEIAASLRAVKD